MTSQMVTLTTLEVRKAAFSDLGFLKASIGLGF
jgi:hypothetical protein